MIKKIDTGIFNIIKDVKENKFEAKVYELGLKEDGLELTNFEFTKDKIGEENIKKLDEIKQKIVSGEIPSYKIAENEIFSINNDDINVVIFVIK